MKNTIIKQLAFFFSFFVLSLGTVTAQSAYQIRFVEVNNDYVTSGNFDLMIQIRSENQSFELGTSNLTFNYNQDGLINPVILSTHNFSGNEYNTISLTEPIGANEGIASVNIELNDGQTAETVDFIDWVDVITIRFEIADMNEMTEISWRDDIDNAALVYPAQLIVMDDNDDLIESSSTNGDLNSPLPVEMISFEAKASGNNVILDWATASEKVNRGFYIQRSTDGRNWSTRGFVDGQGNASTTTHYDFEDLNAFNPSESISLFYYRLKQVDYDGTYEYSDIRSVRFNLQAKEVEVKLYPMPVKNSLTVNLPDYDTYQAPEIHIYNMYGSLIKQLPIDSDIMHIDFAAYRTGHYIFLIKDQTGRNISRETISKLE